MSEEVKPAEAAKSIAIFIRYQDGAEDLFQIEPTVRMQEVFATYAQRKGFRITSHRFLLDGESIKHDATPKMLELEDQDQIDCVTEQHGGDFQHRDG